MSAESLTGQRISPPVPVPVPPEWWRPIAARPGPATLLGCAGLAVAVGVRVAVAGADGARSPGAGLVFAVLLIGLALALGVPRGRLRIGDVVKGLIGAAVLCLGPLITHSGIGSHTAAAGFASWAAVVVVVAAAEEVLLRGALFGVVTRWRGEDAAVLVTAIAFALLHVPVYGWHVLPLDLAVGAGLGALRLWSGGVTAPAVAHIGADLAGWWLR